MINLFLPAIIICAIAVIVMIKQINKLTNKIDAEYVPENPRLYVDFAALIQEKIKALRDDLGDVFSNKITLNDNIDKNEAGEKLSDMIRELSVFTSMLGLNKDSKTIEKELFGVLQKLDNFLENSIVDGNIIADRIRDELLNGYEKLKIQAM